MFEQVLRDFTIKRSVFRFSPPCIVTFLDMMIINELHELLASTPPGAPPHAFTAPLLTEVIPGQIGSTKVSTEDDHPAHLWEPFSSILRLGLVLQPVRIARLSPLVSCQGFSRQRLWRLGRSFFIPK